MCNTSNGTVEAYKTIIDFNKSVITISSTILAGQVAYLVFEKTQFIWTNFVSSALLVFSFIFCLFSFGRAIKTIKDATSRPSTILFANLAAALLVAGIFALLLIDTNGDKTIDKVLKSVEKSTKTFHKQLTADKCNSLELSNENYIISYKNDTATIIVVYSLKEHKVVSIK